MTSSSVRAHVENSFSFLVNAPLAGAMSLFGAEGERLWAGPAWDPKFAYPQPARDVAGAVFSLERDGRQSIWVNTRFDGDQAQYVAIIPDLVASIIDVRLAQRGDHTTQVEVTTRRTALDATADAAVEEMGRSDAISGPRWQEAIAAALATGQRHLP